MERNTDYEIAKQNVTQFPSILWEKFNFFNQTGSTEDYKHSSYCHFDAYNELNSQNILLYSCDLVSRRYFGFCRMLRSCHEVNSWHDFDKKIKKIALGLYYPLLQLVKLMPWVRLMPWLWFMPLATETADKNFGKLVELMPRPVNLMAIRNNGFEKIGGIHATTLQPHGHKAP